MLGLVVLQINAYFLTVFLFFPGLSLFRYLQRQAVELFYVVEQFLPSASVLARGYEYWWQFLPGLEKFVAVLLHVASAGIVAELVELGEHYREWHTVFAEPVEKFQVDLHGLVARIDEDKEVGHLLASQDVSAYHLLQLFALLLASHGEAIAGQIDDIPLIVDEEMVDQ